MQHTPPRGPRPHVSSPGTPPFSSPGPLLGAGQMAAGEPGSVFGGTPLSLGLLGTSVPVGLPLCPLLPPCQAAAGWGQPTHPVTTCAHLLPCFQPAGVTLVSVHCSPDDQTLWALDSRWNVHVRAGITEEMPVGTDWEHVPGSGACPAAATQSLSGRRQQASAPVLPGWGPHQHSTASRPLGFTAGRSFPNRQGLWSSAHSRHLLCRRGILSRGSRPLPGSGGGEAGSQGGQVHPFCTRGLKTDAHPVCLQGCRPASWP